MTLNCNGKLLDLSKPKIMGILNLTPDSFYDGGNYIQRKSVLKQVEKMMLEGVDIVDLGGYSSRPFANDVSIEEELRRTIPVVRVLKNEFPDLILSIDTFRAKVAQEALENGVAIINDISAGNIDEEMFDVIEKWNVPYILMHMRGTPKTMQENLIYDDLILDINHFFSEKLLELQKRKIHDVILDPGFGFGKTINQNYFLLKHLNLIGYQKHPLLVGISRKSMIYKVLNKEPKESLTGTITLNTLAILNGANILRVHDVKKAKEIIQLMDVYNSETALN